MSGSASGRLVSAKLLLLASLLASNTAQAHDNGQHLHEALQRCASITTQPARLDCFDTLAKSSGKPAAAAPQEFGMNPAVAQRSGKALEDSAPNAITELVDSVTRRPNGTLVVTLANGQVWHQRKKDLGLRTKPGDSVTIKRGALGGFRMKARGNKAFKVTRLK